MDSNGDLEKVKIRPILNGDQIMIVNKKTLFHLMILAKEEEHEKYLKAVMG